MNPFCEREWRDFFTRLDLMETRARVVRNAPELPDKSALLIAATVRMVLAQIAEVSRA